MSDNKKAVELTLNVVNRLDSAGWNIYTTFAPSLLHAMVKENMGFFKGTFIEYVNELRKATEETVFLKEEELIRQDNFKVLNNALSLVTN